MNIRLASQRTALSAVAIAIFFTSAAGAQTVVTNPQPRYIVMPAQAASGTTTFSASVSLPTWNGTYTYSGKTYSYNMVGAAPSTGASTTIPVVIIPVKIVITSSTGTKTTFDPTHVLTNGKTVVANTVASPIFDATTTYTLSGTNVGKTQYIDAYQRANFWGTVQSHTGYHLLLGTPTVLAEQTLSPAATYGTTGSVFGFTAGLVDVNWFDTQAHTIMTSLKVTANEIPIFLTYNVYLTQNGSCCIGGYHSAVGAQSYAHSTYVDKTGAFGQDVSALSHEVGEWATDPLVVNTAGNSTPCGVLEVGDPLESLANYGAYPYAVNGFSYNLQDLVFLPYFDAPATTSVHSWFTFHGTTLKACQNGS